MSEEFDWLAENGRLWWPESFAFWLEPETEGELVSWFRKYRPDFRGKVNCAGLEVEIGDPPQQPFNPYANAYANALAIVYFANTVRCDIGFLKESNAMSVLSKPYFHDEEAAFRYLESIVWTDGAVCPHCGGVDRITSVKANPAKRIRIGLHRCGNCKGQFTVKVGTVFEHARIPLHKMLQAVYLMTSSKKGISAHQMHRVLEITYKSAWFLAHRIREAMRDGSLPPMGGEGVIVEADETFIGRIKGAEKRKAFHHKMKVLALIDRGTGKARTMVIDKVKASAIMPIVVANIARESTLMTDESLVYNDARFYFAGHGRTNHSQGSYVDVANDAIHSNTVEGYFSIFKRGMKGIYQHCGEQHLHRYLAEYEFRYNNREKLGCNDKDRAGNALRGIVGKRLTYGGPIATN